MAFSRFNFASVVCALLLASSVIAATNTTGWDYTRARDRPLIIAHRGYASLFPENTLEGFQAAAYAGADFFELDVQMSKEHFLIVSHDAYLSRQTDVANRTEFADKKRTRMLDGKNITDWWICDFTLLELKSLRIRQNQVPNRNQDLNKFFTFPLLSEVLDMLLAFNKLHQGSRNLDGNLVGVVIESKDRQFYINLYDVEQGRLIVDLLVDYNLETYAKAVKVAPVILHSFDAGTVQLWHNITDLPNSQLGTFNVLPYPLNVTRTYADIIGVQISTLYNNTLHKTTGQVEKAKAAGLMVHGWTFRDDSLNWGTDSIDQYVIACDQLFLTGIITEFPEAAMSVAVMLRRERELKKVITSEL